MHKLMGPFPFYLLFGKLIYPEVRKTNQDLSYKEASLQSGWRSSWRFPGRILKYLKYQSFPDDRDLRNQPWDLALLSQSRAMAMLISIEMDPMEWCRHWLALLMFCTFRYFYHGLGNPGNDGNIVPEQDFQEVTVSLRVTCLATRKYYKCW